MKPKTQVTVRNAKKFLKRNAPKILTVASITTELTALVMIFKASPKAHEVLEDVKKTFPNDISKPKALWEETKALAPIMWPGVTLGLLSMCCTVGSYKTSAKQTALALTAVSVAEDRLRTYQKKVIEKLGEEKEKEISHETKQELINKSKASLKDVPITEDGMQIIYDVPSDRFFTARLKDVERAIDKINDRINEEGDFVSVNELYEMLNWNITRLAEDKGWQSFSRNCHDMVTLTVDTCFYKDGITPCISIDYNYGERFDERDLR